VGISSAPQSDARKVLRAVNTRQSGIKSVHLQEFRSSLLIVAELNQLDLEVWNRLVQAVPEHSTTGLAQFVDE